MKIFGHFIEQSLAQIDSFAQGVDVSKDVYGAKIAHGSFLKYLLRYADFDEYHLFVQEAQMAKHSALTVELLGSLHDDARIKLCRPGDFSRLANEINYHVFHRPAGPNITDYLYMRNQFSSGRIPITGVTHTISYQTILKNLTQLMLAGPRPWDSIICTSETARKVMLNLLNNLEARFQEQGDGSIRYKGRLDTIPLGVDADIYKPREKSRVRQQLELPANRIIILSFGRLSDCDKADLVPLLIAFKKALAALSHTSQLEPILLLAGEDTRYSYSEKVKKLAAQLGIANNIIIRPNPPMVLGPLYYSASDIFICPSDNIQETFGLAIIEAMSSGLPVICSDWDGFRHTVLHGKTGLRIPTYWARCDTQLCDNAPMSSWEFDHLYLSQATCVDIDLTVEAICSLVASPDNRCKMANNARNHVLETFEWKIIIARYLKLWDELYRIANSHKEPIHDNTGSWLRPAYCRTFESYPTFELSSDMCVRINSAVGLPDSKEILQQCGELSFKIRPRLSEIILQRAIHGISVGHLEDICSKAVFVQPEEVRWHILRLLKYHYLILNIQPKRFVI